MRKRWKRSIALLLAAVSAAGVLALTGCGHPEEAIYPREYSSIVSREARENNLDEALVYSIIKAESNFDPEAMSRVGAVGLMQLMPSTFDWLLMRDGYPDLTYEDMSRPEINIRYGCHYLEFLSEKYSAIKTIAAAYNAGHGAVDSWLKDPNYSDDGINLKYIPYGETAAYAEKVAGFYEKYNELYYS